MRLLNDLLLSSADAASSFDSASLLIEAMIVASIQAQWTGDVDGVIQVQASNDAGTTPTNWDDVADKKLEPAGSAGHGFIELTDIGYRWIRLTWASTSGTGTITACVNAKGA